MSYQRASNRLLIRPRVNLEESFQSYLIRLARANGYKYSAFSSGITTKSKSHRSMKLADRIEIRKLIKLIADSNSSELVDIWECGYSHKQLFDYSRIKFCTQCFLEDEVLKPYWWLKNYLVCAKHNALMIDSCPSCNEKINEDSFIHRCCSVCEQEFASFKAEQVEADLYGKTISKLFSNFVGNTDTFIEILDEYINKLYTQFFIGSALLKYTREKAAPIDNRRFFSLKELFNEQVAVQELIHEGDIKRQMFSFLCDEKAHSGLGIPHALNPIFDLIFSKHGELFEIELIKLLFAPEKEMEVWSVGILWVEKVFRLTKGELKLFIKEKYPELELKRQGPFTVEVKNIKFILSEYAHVNSSFSVPSYL